MKILKALLLTAISLATLNAGAAPLSPEEALARITTTSHKQIAVNPSQFKLVHTVEENGNNAVYVFTKDENKGFIVVSADDATDSLLGYGDSDFTDENGNIAPECEYWLGEYAKQVAYASGTNHNMHRNAPREARERISPLCSTKWSQSWPYNNKCPIKNGERCVTGCAATSMSQVMKYHNWPPVGEGSNSYKWGKYTLKMNFSQVSFDWDNMIDIYRSTATEEQQEAVAQLMKAVGYGINMNYSPSGSGAIAPDMGKAFVNFFRYSKSMKYLERDWFSLPEWENLIYESLRNYGPVVYNGQSNEGGHSFVCDGYSSAGYFHINWGWGGTSDGYFLLDVLDPIEQGIGGGNSAFNRSQQVFIDLTPDEDGTSEPYYQLAVNNGLALNITDDTILMQSLLYNPGALLIPSGAFGLCITKVNQLGIPVGEPDYYGYTIGKGEENGEEGEEDDEGLPVLYGYRDVDFDVSDLQVGRYSVKPFFQWPDGSMHDVMARRDMTSEYILSVTATRKTLKPVTNSIPDISDAAFPETFDNENPVSIKGTITNSVNNSRVLQFRAVVMSEDLSEQLCGTNTVTVTLEADATTELDFSATLKSYAGLEPGKKYPMVLVISDGAGGNIILAGPEEVLYTGESRVCNPGEEPISGHRVYFNTLGIKVGEAAAGEPAPELPSGIYIVRSANSTLKIRK